MILEIMTDNYTENSKKRCTSLYGMFYGIIMVNSDFDLSTDR